MTEESRAHKMLEEARAKVLEQLTPEERAVVEARDRERELEAQAPARDAVDYRARYCPLGWNTVLRQNTTPAGLLAPGAPAVAEIEQRVEIPKCIGPACMLWRDDCVLPGILQALVDLAVGVRIASGEPVR